MVDDLNVRLGCYGYPVRSPSVDRLAREGRRFERAYCQIPSCSPSRTSLLTGWRAERTGVWDNLQPPRERLTGAVPLQEHFHAHGYFTARVGKIYHGPFEDQFHWDVAEHAVPVPGDEAWEPPPKKRQGKGRLIGAPLDGHRQPRRGQPDSRTARRVAELIGRVRDGLLHRRRLQQAHIHWIAPRPYFSSTHRTASRPTVPTRSRRHPEIAIFRKRARPFPGWPWRTRRRVPARATAAYYACVSFMDAQVGVLLETLDRLKLRDRTIVVLLGDHGFHLGEHGGQWRKNTLFEESLRVPFILAAPGLPEPGIAARGLVESLDLYPTLVDLAGLPTVPGLDGKSLRPLLDDPRQTVGPRHSPSLAESPELGRSCVTSAGAIRSGPTAGRTCGTSRPRAGWSTSRAPSGPGRTSRHPTSPAIRALPRSSPT
jgi:uncharacterized sulfatase